MFIIAVRTHDFAEMHYCGMKTLILPCYDQHFLLLVFIIGMRTHDCAEALLWHDKLLIPFFDQHLLLMVLIIGMRTHDYAEMYYCGMNTF